MRRFSCPNPPLRVIPVVKFLPVTVRWRTMAAMSSGRTGPRPRPSTRKKRPRPLLAGALQKFSEINWQLARAAPLPAIYGQACRQAEKHDKRPGFRNLLPVLSVEVAGDLRIDAIAADNLLVHVHRPENDAEGRCGIGTWLPSINESHAAIFPRARRKKPQPATGWGFAEVYRYSGPLNASRVASSRTRPNWPPDREA